MFIHKPVSTGTYLNTGNEIPIALSHPLAHTQEIYEKETTKIFNEFSFYWLLPPTGRCSLFFPCDEGGTCFGGGCTCE